MSYYYITHDTDYLEHHGIRGQKWGIRKYQNEDGTLTPAGRERYGVLGNEHSDKEASFFEKNLNRSVQSTMIGKSRIIKGLREKRLYTNAALSRNYKITKVPADKKKIALGIGIIAASLAAGNALTNLGTKSSSNSVGEVMAGNNNTAKAGKAFLGSLGLIVAGSGIASAGSVIGGQTIAKGAGEYRVKKKNE